MRLTPFYGRAVLCRAVMMTAVCSFAVTASFAQVQTTKPVLDRAPQDRQTGAPVVLAGEPLFSVYTNLGPYSPQDRAVHIADRLTQLSKEPLARIETIVAVDRGERSDVVLGQTIIMTVTEGDAQPLGRTRQQVAEDYALKMRQVLGKMREETSLKAMLINSLYELIDVAIVLALLVFFHRAFPKLYTRLHDWRGTYIRAITIQTVELVSAEQIVSFLVSLAKGIRLVATLLILYFYISSALGIFPQTRGISAQLFGALLSTLKVIGMAFLTYAPDVFAIVVIIVVTRYLIKLIHLIFGGIERGAISFPGFYKEWAEPTYRIVRFLVIVFAIIATFPYIPGSGSAGFRGVSVFLGLLISLGSAAAVGNIIAGIFLTYMRPFRVGDRVKIADTIGDVIEKTLLVTRIRTIKNVDVTIPNGMVLGSHMINYSSVAKEHGLILHTSVTIGYDARWRTVHELLRSAARDTRHILQRPEPFVLQTSLNDFYVTYELNAYTDQPNLMESIYSELHQNIQDRFNEAGVEIMSPHYAQIRDGNKTTIPEPYLPKTYTPPAFRITQLPMNSPSPGSSPQKGRGESEGASGKRDELLPRVDKD